MTKLEQLEACMRPQFLWEKDPQKILQVREDMEGAKDAARLMMVGLADMFGFKQDYVMDWLEMSYDSYRSKLGQFKANLREAHYRKQAGILGDTHDQVTRFWNKLNLCLNAIRWQHRNTYFKLTDYIDDKP